jgi:hypothetical protein
MYPSVWGKIVLTKFAFLQNITTTTTPTTADVFIQTTSVQATPNRSADSVVELLPCSYARNWTTSRPWHWQVDTYAYHMRYMEARSCAGFASNQNIVSNTTKRNVPGIWSTTKVICLQFLSMYAFVCMFCVVCELAILLCLSHMYFPVVPVV